MAQHNGIQSIKKHKAQRTRGGEMTVNTNFSCRIIFLFLVISSQSSIAQSLDTTRVSEIAPGVEHYLIRSERVPLTINVVAVNLKKQGVSLRVVKAMRDGREILAAREEASKMMEEANVGGTLAVAAVNGGFFNLKGGSPINLDIQNGMIARMPGAKGRLSALLFNSDNKAKIGRFRLDVALAVSDTTFHVDDINEVSRTDQIVLFDRFYGSRTASGFHGAALVLVPIGKNMVGGDFRFVVDTLIHLSRSLAIPQSGYVLAMRGHVGRTALRKLSIRDTVRLLTRFTPEVERVAQGLGGLPEIVLDGKNVSAAMADSEQVNAYISDEHHARTAVGVSKDGTKVFLVVVDGDEKTSAGVTLSELANLMIRLGSYDALNLDGGGSATLAIKGTVINSPSDSTGERAVSDALVVTSIR